MMQINKVWPKIDHWRSRLGLLPLKDLNSRPEGRCILIAMSQMLAFNVFGLFVFLRDQIYRFIADATFKASLIRKERFLITHFLWKGHSSYLLLERNCLLMHLAHSVPALLDHLNRGNVICRQTYHRGKGPQSWSWRSKYPPPISVMS